jgi:hypothetical protein
MPKTACGTDPEGDDESGEAGKGRAPGQRPQRILHVLPQPHRPSSTAARYARTGHRFALEKLVEIESEPFEQLPPDLGPRIRPLAVDELRKVPAVEPESERPGILAEPAPRDLSREALVLQSNSHRLSVTSGRQDGPGGSAKETKTAAKRCQFNPHQRPAPLAGSPL